MPAFDTAVSLKGSLLHCLLFCPIGGEGVPGSSLGRAPDNSPETRGSPKFAGVAEAMKFIISVDPKPVPHGPLMGWRCLGGRCP